MRIPRIYQPGPLTSSSEVSLEDSAAQHVAKVLRLREDAEIILFDGEGNSFNAVITGINKKAVTVAVRSHIDEHTESPLAIHLGLATSKGERMDYAIQKSVEAGVAQITPVITEHTVVRLDEKRKQTRLQHWQGVIQHACEQSGRSVIPVIRPITELADWLNTVDADAKFILDTGTQTGLKDIATIPKDVCVLVGPEGGLSETEVQVARQNGFQSIKLGPRIFRTETAAVVACTVLQTLWGDLVR